MKVSEIKELANALGVLAGLVFVVVFFGALAVEAVAWLVR